MRGIVADVTLIASDDIAAAVLRYHSRRAWQIVAHPWLEIIYVRFREAKRLVFQGF